MISFIKHIFKVATITISMVFATMSVNAQCCAAGNPVGGEGGAQNISSKELIVSLGYRYSLSKNYYHLDQKEDYSKVERSFYNFSKLYIAYGLNYRIIIDAEMGYFFNKTQEVNLTDGNESIYAKGFGDLGINFRFSLLKRLFFNPNKLIFSVGSIIPIGAFNEQMDGITIPISLQPSSGATKFNTGLYYSHKEKGKSFGYAGRVFFEYSNQINKDFLIYKYGQIYIFEASLLYSKNTKFSMRLNGKLEYRTADHREDGIKIESSGGYFTSLIPVFLYKPTPTFSIIAAFDIPLYRYVNGYQLTNLFAFRVGVSKKIMFSKKKGSEDSL